MMPKTVVIYMVSSSVDEKDVKAKSISALSGYMVPISQNIMEVILETLIEFCFHIILNQLQHGSISRFQPLLTR
jgi:hypothetical protein